MAHELILHHYDFSSCSEKVRLILGLKGLTWRSVEIPSVLSKPNYMPLSGGYRRALALQIGADVFCDSKRIIEELERRFPQPSIYPGPDEGETRMQAGDVLIQRGANHAWRTRSNVPALVAFVLVGATPIS